MAHRPCARRPVLRRRALDAKVTRNFDSPAIRSSRLSESFCAVPALTPSLTGLTSQATFGFNVKCCAATGNLSYHDHGANVRIKATSFDRLIISAGVCGSNTHATFTGTATVTRSTGSNSETLTVEVDDCGEPGTTDTFGIETDTYSKPPTTLTGGNIQIHK